MEQQFEIKVLLIGGADAWRPCLVELKSCEPQAVVDPDGSTRHERQDQRYLFAYAAEDGREGREYDGVFWGYSDTHDFATHEFCEYASEGEYIMNFESSTTEQVKSLRAALWRITERVRTEHARKVKRQHHEIENLSTVIAGLLKIIKDKRIKIRNMQ